MLMLGLRMGEALGLKWEDVDLDRSTVFVRRALQRVVKEDGSTELQLVEPKSDRSYRLVSIPASIVAFLARHRARQNRERLVAGSRWQQTGHTFASTIGTPLDERNVRREFYDLLKAQNLPRMRPHDLRHSYATILLATGEHPKVVQEILGHSSVQLTLDTYSHLLPISCSRNEPRPNWTRFSAEETTIPAKTPARRIRRGLLIRRNRRIRSRMW